MQVLTTNADFRAVREATHGSLGFVPTMGYLHDGHMELVRRARADNDIVAASIFVNPTQFGPNEDLAAYPRDFERDTALLEAEGCDLLYYPAPEEVYPPGFDISIEVGTVTTQLEGAKRPGHFRGMATVVAKLFNVVQPDSAYFGQKDGQQVTVVKKMVHDLDMPVEIVVVPTVREADGLARSSRNVYLQANEREAAVVLHRALNEVERLFAGGLRDANALRAAMTEILKAEPLANVDYVSVADATTLEELSTMDGDAMASLAVQIGKARLIDNVLLLQ